MATAQPFPPVELELVLKKVASDERFTGDERQVVALEVALRKVAKREPLTREERRLVERRLEELTPKPAPLLPEEAEIARLYAKKLGLFSGPGGAEALGALLADREKALERFGEVLAHIQAQAGATGANDLTDEDIEAEIAAARAERRRSA